MAIKVLVPSGVLGLGFDSEALQRGLALKPDIICIDGGSTDSGPFYLGVGESKYSRASTKSEWRELMQARAQAGVPLVIGSCGTCGTNSAVDWMFDITRELAAELGHTLKVARLYSSQSAEHMLTAFKAGRLSALEAAPELSEAVLADCSNIVALAGAEQIQAALELGADIVLAGRTTDTAVISALPLMKGCHAGAVWHGAKIAECGALCSTNPTSGVIMVSFDVQGFTVEPLATDVYCTPHSVSAHMLYENSDPFKLYEPGGYLDVSKAQYEALDEKRVRVTGSSWHATEPYTVKLEGAKVAGYQSTIMAILRDERYVLHAKEWLQKLSCFLEADIQKRMNLTSTDYTLEFRLLGVDSALGALESKLSQPAEVGVLGLITAASQELASEIAKLINPFVLHYPLTKDEELPTFAFPYSPAQTDRGALYEFCLNHVLELSDPMDAFKLKVDVI